MNESRHVLLVDDDHNLLSALRRTFRDEPFEIALAPSPAAALRHLAIAPVDVLVSDLQMPGMTGTELVSRTRALHPHVLSIMLTGHGDLASAMQAINSGEVFRFFTKPCDTSALAAAIREALLFTTPMRAARLDLERARRRLGTGGGASARRNTADTAGASIVFEADPTPVDLGAVLREIQADLDADDATRRG